jgi:hypothetical protein
MVKGASMIKNAQFIVTALLASGLSLAGCATNGAVGTPGATTVTQNAAALQASATASEHVAGQYTGTVNDHFFSKGVATIDLSQYRTSVGGRFTATYTHAKVQSSVALSLVGHALVGTSVATVANAACAFSQTAFYDAHTFTLTGKYKAIHGCTGDEGTFIVKEACYYVTDAVDAIKPDTMGLRPC